MKAFILVLASLNVYGLAQAQESHQPFLWGVANSAFQVEGSPADSDIYRNTHLPCNPPTVPCYVKDHTNADIATDFWNRYDEDFALAQNLGANGFRMSIAWERIEPARGQWDEVALAHYEKIISAMRARGMEPIVTLFHNVLPVWVADQGGVLAPDFANIFAEYAEHTVAKLSTGPANVHYWLTFNEPTTYAEGSYSTKSGGALDFLRALKGQSSAHNESYQRIHALPNSADIKVSYAQDWEDFELRHWIQHFNPLDDLALFFTNRFYDRGFLSQVIHAGPNGKANLDYLGINYYTRSMVKFSFKGFVNVSPGPGPQADIPGMEIYPPGFEKVLKDASKYNLPILVTENGVTDATDRLRPQFLQDHIKYLMKAKNEDHINIIGYMHWSLTDNFEWEWGLSQRYGLIAVDYSTLTKTPRSSYYVYKKLIEDNRAQENAKILGLPQN